MDNNSIVDYFVSKGYAPHQAAGIAGNLTQESGNNPSIVNKTSGAFGLAQWLGSRKTQLHRFAQANGASIHDPRLQMDFIDHELNTTESRAREKLMQTRTAGEAAAAFSDHFERAGKNEKNNARRQRIADQALNNYGGGSGYSGGAGGASDIPSLEDFVAAKKSKPQMQSPQPEASNKIPSLEEFVAAKKSKPAQPEYTEGNTVAGDIGHSAGVTGRSLLEGAVGLPASIYNTMKIIPNYIKDKTGAMDLSNPLLAMTGAVPLPDFLSDDGGRTANTEQYGTSLADYIGLPKATKDDLMNQQISKGLGGFVIPTAAMAKLGKAGGLIEGFGKAMGGANPFTASAGIIGGGAAQEGAREMGASDNVQLAANIAGNVAGGGLAGIANMAGRTGARVGRALINSNEGVAGRVLNRAAGEQAPQVIADLESGVVPSITGKMIKGYQPTSSEIAGNAGVSSILRQAGLDPDTAVSLADRQFQNSKAVKDYLEKGAAGGLSKRASIKGDAKTLAEQKLWNKVDTISKPMRTRDLPVDLTPVESAIESALLKNKGNPSIVAGIEKLKSSMPTGGAAGFDETYNFKQWIDELLSSTDVRDIDALSVQKAKTALESVKSALANTMTATEPEFKQFLQEQAKGLGRIEQRSLADKIITAKSATVPKVANTPAGQEELYSLTGSKLKTVTKDPKLMAQLSPVQRRMFEKAQQHAALESRDQAGAMVGSNTAQNLNIRDVVAQDIMEAIIGNNKASNLIGKAAGGLASAVMPRGLINSRTMSSTGVANILAKAKLDPKYAAHLMKTYGLGHKNFNDTAARATLRGLMTNPPKTGQ